jgi:hypothetical protein
MRAIDHPKSSSHSGILWVALGAWALAGLGPAPGFAQSKTGQAKGGAAQDRGVAPGAPRVDATLAQLMRGIVYPASNIVFAAQGDDPAKFPEAKDAAAATDLLASSYGKWQAVENSALAMDEAANLLVLPGRKCSNGIAVPIGNADWAKLVQGLRDAAMISYKAALARDQDKILTAAEALTNACAACHDKYREKPNLSDRCK